MSTITVILNYGLEPNEHIGYDGPMNAFKGYAIEYYDIADNSFRDQIKITPTVYKFVSSLKIKQFKRFISEAVYDQYEASHEYDTPSIVQVWYNDTQIY
jgi:hypothetical protein